MSGKSPIDISGITVSGIASEVESAKKDLEEKIKKEQAALAKIESGDPKSMLEGICTLGDIENISGDTIVRLAEIKSRLDESRQHPDISQKLGHACKQ